MSEKQRKLKIISHGNLKECRVVDAETGENIIHVTSVSIRIDQHTRFVPVAEITLFDPEIELEADTEVTTTVAYKKLN